jgi:hypothetical protein
MNRPLPPAPEIVFGPNRPNTADPDHPRLAAERLVRLIRHHCGPHQTDLVVVFLIGLGFGHRLRVGGAEYVHRPVDTLARRLLDVEEAGMHEWRPEPEGSAS